MTDHQTIQPLITSRINVVFSGRQIIIEALEDVGYSHENAVNFLRDHEIAFMQWSYLEDFKEIEDIR